MEQNPLFKNLHILECTGCHFSEWIIKDDAIFCKNCNNKYQKIENKIIACDNYFVEEKWEETNVTFEPKNPKNPWINRINGPKIVSLRNKYNIEGFAINLGSGQDTHKGFINIDLGNYKPVHIVSDITKTPIRSNSIELIVSNSVLEHIYNYQEVIKEAHRILSKGGIFYLCVPAVCPRHHQYDFHRWTSLGLKKLLENDFKIIDHGVSRGIAHFITTYINQVIELKIKNNILKKLIEIFWRIISLPLFLIRDDNSEYNQALADTIYIIGQKK